MVIQFPAHPYRAPPPAPDLTDLAVRVRRVVAVLPGTREAWLVRQPAGVRVYVVTRSRAGTVSGVGPLDDIRVALWPLRAGMAGRLDVDVVPCWSVGDRVRDEGWMVWRR